LYFVIIIKKTKELCQWWLLFGVGCGSSYLNQSQDTWGRVV